MFLVSSILSLTPVYTIQRYEDLKSIYADADTYIYEKFPTTNYGSSYFLIGNSSDYEIEAYLHFPFTVKPSKWIDPPEIRIHVGTSLEKCRLLNELKNQGVSKNNEKKEHIKI